MVYLEKQREVMSGWILMETFICGWFHIATNHHLKLWSKPNKACCYQRTFGRKEICHLFTSVSISYLKQMITKLSGMLCFLLLATLKRLASHISVYINQFEGKMWWNVNGFLSWSINPTCSYNLIRNGVK